ncbi:hypothetical protein [Conexibacter sp. SYSU D00693]|uniref:hypothetical protein n=1 Tax=Conexibacter sp. SYSU D00693 TaxID=2812560 RepID=UPI00196A9DC0|nr:hypothetical protein [Conexibacter sp. SYSU D00693]
MPSSVPPGLSAPARDRGPLWLLLGGGSTAAVLVVLALLATGGGATEDAPARPATPPVAAAPAAAAQPPAQPSPAPVPSPQASPVAAVRAAPAPTAVRVSLDERRFAANDREHVRAGWVAAFYPIYERASKAYGVNWLLLASIHKQETAFSTHPTTYRGLNFARCCAGPMQFNVTNGPVSTWERYRHAHRAAARPASYNHRTAEHPSPYDDFDAIMAAAALLRDSGAGAQLDASAWRAAYDYYGHDLTGVDYASQVLARAISWGRSRFCVNCELDGGVLAAVDGSWGAPVRAEVQAAEEAAAKQRAKRARTASVR